MSICTGNITSHYPDFDRHQRVVRTQGEMKGGEERWGEERMQCLNIKKSRGKKYEK